MDAPQDATTEPPADEPVEPAPPPPKGRDDDARKRRDRWLRVGAFALVAGIAAFFVLPKLPHGQQVRLHLGSGSTRVTGATARVGRGGAWEREASWRFDRGAPPTVVWQFELPNGGADVEIELSSATRTVTRASKVELRGDETNVELGEAMRGLDP